MAAITAREKKVAGAGGEGGIRTRGSLLSYARLASEYLRPLGHLSRYGVWRSATRNFACVRVSLFGCQSCGGGGIRTPGAFQRYGFQDRRLRPLGHSSRRRRGSISQ